LNVAEICRVVGLPQPTVSRQLTALKDSKLVADRRTGPWVFHRLAIDAAEPLARTMIGAIRPILEAPTAEGKRDRVRLDRVLKDRQEIARRYYAGNPDRNPGTRQSRFGGAAAWRTWTIGSGAWPRRGARGPMNWPGRPLGSWPGRPPGRRTAQGCVSPDSPLTAGPGIRSPARSSRAASISWCDGAGRPGRVSL
jgi:hypothetical protein